MIPLPPNPRFERKFLAEGLGLAEVLALVRRHPAAFREVYPPRGINSLYLDSPDLRDYRDHVNGIALRAKTRIRWYGPWAGHIEAPSLERKFKHAHVSGKASHRLPPLAMSGHAWSPGLEAAFDSADLPLLTRAALRHLQPSLLNRYERHYFRSADGRFCVTVDSGLQFAPARQAQGLGICFGPPTALLIIELKFGLGEAEDAATVTNALPFRLARCSKYVLGINALAV